MKISNTPQEDGKYQLKIEVNDVNLLSSEPFEWEKPEAASVVSVDNKEYPSIFGELRKLKFWKLSDPE